MVVKHSRGRQERGLKTSATFSAKKACGARHYAQACGPHLPLRMPVYLSFRTIAVDPAELFKQWPKSFSSRVARYLANKSLIVPTVSWGCMVVLSHPFCKVAAAGQTTHTRSLGTRRFR
ncbi:hypothetical protein NPIL_386751 [Nephila pilipes]|uniref:Uncharacterized protein n=1 Tax=Nephila pilipes TaxID=299642 RepID=A0A8X6U5L5_NEPPI|nr:hypothetical protein NPIL_386751 [Nephila pilipes]